MPITKITIAPQMLSFSSEETGAKSLNNAYKEANDLAMWMTKAALLISWCRTYPKLIRSGFAAHGFDCTIKTYSKKKRTYSNYLLTITEVDE